MLNRINKYKDYVLNKKYIYILLFIYSFILVFFCSRMSPLYPINDWADVNLYFTIGKAIFNGITPYTEAFDHKGPIIFFIYGIGYLIANDSFFGVFILLVLGWFIISLLSYHIASLYLDKSYAYLVAIISPILMHSHTLEGGSAEEFILFAIAASLYLFLKYFKDDNSHPAKYALIHGLLVSAVFLTKPNLIVFWIMPLMAVFVMLVIKKDKKAIIQNLLAFIVGVLIIFLPICLYFYINNALGEAFDIYIVLNKAYVQLPEWTESLRLLIVRFYQRFRFDFLYFSIIMLGVAYFPFKFIKNKLGAWSICLAFASLYIVIYSSSVYVYYYSIPYYAFIILGLIAIANYLNKYVKINFTWHICLFFTLIATMAAINYKSFFGYETDVLLRKIEDKSIANQFGKHIEKVSNPSIVNLSLDASNVLFTKYNILPTVRYFTSPNLNYEQYPNMRNEQTKYIENKETDFVLISDATFNYEYFNELAMLHINYELIDSYRTKGAYASTHYIYKKKTR